jgi:hypothetical protein
MPELRSEGRVPVEAQPALVTVLEGCNSDKIPVSVVNISRKGLGLRSDRRIPQDVWVKIDLSYALVFGEVKHCSQDEKGYRVGIRTDTVIHREQGRER